MTLFPKNPSLFSLVFPQCFEAAGRLLLDQKCYKKKSMPNEIVAGVVDSAGGTKMCVVYFDVTADP